MLIYIIGIIICIMVLILSMSTFVSAWRKADLLDKKDQMEESVELGQEMDQVDLDEYQAAKEINEKIQDIE